MKQSEAERIIEQVITKELMVSGSANWARILAPKIVKALSEAMKKQFVFAGGVMDSTGAKYPSGESSSTDVKQSNLNQMQMMTSTLRTLRQQRKPHGVRRAPCYQSPGILNI